MVASTRCTTFLSYPYRLWGFVSAKPAALVVSDLLGRDNETMRVWNQRLGTVLQSRECIVCVEEAKREGEEAPGRIAGKLRRSAWHHTSIHDHFFFEFLSRLVIALHDDVLLFCIWNDVFQLISHKVRRTRQAKKETNKKQIRGLLAGGTCREGIRSFQWAQDTSK